MITSIDKSAPNQFALMTGGCAGISDVKNVFTNIQVTFRTFG
jgi:hypothetical protein